MSLMADMGGAGVSVTYKRAGDQTGRRLPFARAAWTATPWRKPAIRLPGGAAACGPAELTG